MLATTKYKMFLAIAGVLGVAALVLAVFGFFLIRAGAYPPSGTGSLGHVGMVIAGGIAEFIAFVFILFTIFFIFKARAIVRQL